MTKTLILPSGKTAVIRKGKGFDLFQAQKKAKFRKAESRRKPSEPDFVRAG